MEAIWQTLELLGIVPVVKLDDAKDAVPLAKALCDGGLPCAEITFRTDAAEESIRAISKAFPEMVVGAGTVLTRAQVDKAMAAGARFIVSPGLNPDTVRYCQEKGIPIVPGCANASDIELALSLGLEIVKFFPAEASGGLSAIKALSGPFPNLRFMPTGGVSEANLNSYLSFSKIVACGGSWMVPQDKITSGDFAGITALTRSAIHTMLGFELAHIGINTGTEEAASAAAQTFSTLLGAPVKAGTSSIFTGSIIELLKVPGLGRNGHIAIATNSLSRAAAYWKRLGFAMNESSLKTDAKGNPTACYLQDEIGGFAMHLLQKK